MIKVNLLKDQTVRVRRAVKLPAPSQMGLLLMGLALLCAGAMGFWWYRLDTQIGSLTQLRNRLRIESDRLQALKKEIDKFDHLKQLTQSRIEVIETLKENQTGPVNLLNRVIQSMPRDASLWLSSIDQKADRIQIKGLALRSESVPDLMASLSATGYFKSVDLETLEAGKEAGKDADRFSLICVSNAKAVDPNKGADVAKTAKGGKAPSNHRKPAQPAKADY